MSKITAAQNAELKRLLTVFTPEEIETGKVQRRQTQANTQSAVSATEFQIQLENALIEQDLQNALKRLRKERGETLAELATQIGISTTRAGQIEKEAANLELRTLVRHVEALGYELTLTFTPKNPNGKVIQTHLHSL
jgi:DNA-binding XRE family transcriptional regulator